MATADEYFTHLLQTYGSFKGASESGPRREVAQKVLEFLNNESEYVNFEAAAPSKDQDVAELSRIR